MVLQNQSPTAKFRLNDLGRGLVWLMALVFIWLTGFWTGCTRNQTEILVLKTKMLSLESGSIRVKSLIASEREAREGWKEAIKTMFAWMKMSEEWRGKALAAEAVLKKLKE